eukprot:gene7299-9944_t
MFTIIFALIAFLQLNSVIGFHGQSRIGMRSTPLLMNNKERTYIMIKPDGVQRRVVGEIITRFEAKGYLLKGLKLTTPSKETLEEHYRDLKEKSFFPKLMGYMSSGPVVAMVWEGKNAVKTGRVMLGATNPLESAPGTIRGDFAVEVGRNICHGSDSVESAEREISLWFKEGLNEYSSHSNDWIYE